VDEARMRRNLDLTRGGIMAEAVMMALAPKIGHERAHAVVAAAARKTGGDGNDLRAVLAEDPVVSANLSSERLERLLDPAAYLGRAGASVDVVVGRRGSLVS
jgi:3-carboxy-cis,cis-muconate cycloisomerase